MLREKENKTVETEYWAFSKKFNFFDYLNPINIEECKIQFFNSIENGVDNFNPKFEYQEYNFKVNKVIKELLDYKEYFIDLNTFESTVYLKTIDNQVEWLQRMANRKDSTFNKWLSSLYGRPDFNDIESAKAEIKKLNPIQLNENFTPTMALERINLELSKRSYTNWTCELKDIAAKIYIDSLNTKILINPNRNFSSIELDRLIVHEIDTHVLRHENGKRQDYLIYAYGFPNYIETEEGLALFAEYKNGFLTDKDLAKYCARIIAAYYTLDLSFYNLFVMISKLVDKDLAFDIVVRVKRGLNDSSQLGGFTKDQVYYSGLNKIKNIKSNLMKQLYIGKIGLSDLKNVPNLSTKLSMNTKIPIWIE